MDVKVDKKAFAVYNTQRENIWKSSSRDKTLFIAKFVEKVMTLVTREAG